jgi:hypothetical protein
MPYVWSIWAQTGVVAKAIAIDEIAVVSRVAVRIRRISFSC